MKSFIIILVLLFVTDNEGYYNTFKSKSCKTNANSDKLIIYTSLLYQFTYNRVPINNTIFPYTNIKHDAGNWNYSSQPILKEQEIYIQRFLIKKG